MIAAKRRYESLPLLIASEATAGQLDISRALRPLIERRRADYMADSAATVYTID